MIKVHGIIFFSFYKSFAFSMDDWTRTEARLISYGDGWEKEDIALKHESMIFILR